MIRLLFTLFSIALISTGAIAAEGENDKKKKPKKPKLEAGIYAEFTTSKGVIIVKLEHEKAPMTVANFVGLTEGNFKVDTLTITKPYYSGLKFHRVIADFMIQGGCPQGTGMGNPGYKFEDEFHPDLTHSGPGILSMANSGPGTNGSQFFITHKATTWLDGKHSVFGHVVFGQDVVNAIAQDDLMTTVRIIRKGKAAKSWDAIKVFDETRVVIKKKMLEDLKVFAQKAEAEGDLNSCSQAYKELMRLDPTNAEYAGKVKAIDAKIRDEKQLSAQKMEELGDLQGAMQAYGELSKLDPRNKEYAGKVEAIKKKIEEEQIKQKEYVDKVVAMKPADFNAFMYQEVLKKYPTAKQTASGLAYIIETQGTGPIPETGSKMSVHYLGTFRTTGAKFDASYDRGQPMNFQYKVNRMVPGFEEGLGMFPQGTKAKIFIPYHLAYGAQGRGGAIPPYSDLIFDLDIIDVKPAEVQQHEHHDGDGHNHDGHNH